MATSIKIENFPANDKEKVLDLLKRAELPVQDLTDQKMENFMIAKGKDGSIIGVVGIELCQKTGLLRSLAVHPAHRGTGLGKLLTGKIESFAKHNGIRTLYLLTMTAADFFAKLGYQLTQRDNLPESIRKTAEFKNLCPISAKCYTKFWILTDVYRIIKNDYKFSAARLTST
jgi:amino-acid N-acetyltransferase